jgi:KAP family P-loop domain
MVSQNQEKQFCRKSEQVPCLYITWLTIYDSSYVIDHFIHLESMPARAYKLLFFYFRYDMESSADSVICELLRQFCSGDDQIPSAVEDMNTRYESTAEMPSIAKLLKVFQAVVEQSKYEVIVVIDALDECSWLSIRDMLKALKSLSEATITNLHLFITSDPYTVTQDNLRPELSLSMDQLLNRYITEQVGMLSHRMTNRTRRQLERVLLENSSGM